MTHLPLQPKGTYIFLTTNLSITIHSKNVRFTSITYNLRLPDTDYLGIYRIGKNFVRCEKDRHPSLLNEQTLTPLFKTPINDVLCPLNGPEFVVVKNGLSTVFNAYGKQLTDFIKGRFEWKWAPYNPLMPHERIIYNKEANIQLHAAWPMFQNKQRPRTTSSAQAIS